MFLEACDICNTVSIVMKWLIFFRIEIQNTSAKPGKLKQLQNKNTIGLESRDIKSTKGNWR